MNNLDKKILLLQTIFKPNSNLPGERFYLLKDHEGWTDGFMADLTNLNVETMQAKAVLKKDKTGFQYKVDKETCPNIAKLINEDKSHLVTDIEIDISHDQVALKLISEGLVAYITPKFMQYFWKAYSNMSLELYLTGALSAVNIYCEDELVGLVMPLKVED